jgi:hypothetical protein
VFRLTADAWKEGSILGRLGLTMSGHCCALDRMASADGEPSKETGLAVRRLVSAAEGRRRGIGGRANELSVSERLEGDCP